MTIATRPFGLGTSLSTLPGSDERNRVAEGLPVLASRRRSDRRWTACHGPPVGSERGCGTVDPACPLLGAGAKVDQPGNVTGIHDERLRPRWVEIERHERTADVVDRPLA